jgi:hypothetical protein
MRDSYLGMRVGIRGMTQWRGLQTVFRPGGGARVPELRDPEISLTAWTGE